MAKVKEQEQEQHNDIAIRDDAAVAVAESEPDNSLALSQQFLAETNAEIMNDLLSLDVANVTSARKELLDKNLHLHDAILMTFEGFKTDKDDGVRVVYFLSDDDGFDYKVAQSPVGSRLTIYNIFNKTRTIGRKLTLTNVRFIETGKPKFGNMPVILQTTPQTKVEFS